MRCPSRRRCSCSGSRGAAAAAASPASPAVVVIVQVASVAPWWIRGDHTVANASADPFVVMTSNLHLGRGDPGAVLAAADDHEVDVLVVLEAAPDVVAALRAHGMEQKRPHTLIRPGPGASGALIASRHPLATIAVPPVPPQLYPAHAVTVQASRAVTVLAAHPAPPWSGHNPVAQGERRTRRLGRPCAARRAADGDR